MVEVGSIEAENTLSALLDRAEHGEEIVITRRGRPVAKLVPIAGVPGSDQVRQAAQRIRDLAKAMNLGPFDWDEWKPIGMKASGDLRSRCVGNPCLVPRG